MNMPRKRIGSTREFRRIRERGPNPSTAEFNEAGVGDFIKEGLGEINYDSQLGWLVSSEKFGEGESVGLSLKHSTRYLRRHDGLPGSRP
jgi:hypothetical protein